MKTIMHILYFSLKNPPIYYPNVASHLHQQSVSATANSLTALVGSGFVLRKEK